MIDSRDLNAFVTVVRAGSFTAAAQVLGTQKAHLSRVVTRLESCLGVRLLQRSTRALSLTEAGRELFERAVTILDALSATEARLRDTAGRPQGTLRLSCGVEFGLLVLGRWVEDYLQRYPETRVEMDLSSRLVDLVHEGVDVALRIGSPRDSALSARKLGELRYALYASPTHLGRVGLPPAPEALAEADTVMFAPTVPVARPTWNLMKGSEQRQVTIQPRLLLDNMIAVRDAAAAGLGIAMLPRFQGQVLVREGRLVEVLPGWARPPVPVTAVFASSRYLAPKVRAFVDLAVDRYREVIAAEA